MYQFVPDSEANPDYLRQMVELITLLAFFEDRHPIHIIDDILQGAAGGANGSPRAPSQAGEAEAARK